MRNHKNYFSKKERTDLLNKKVIFVFLTIFKLKFHDADHFLYYPRMSVFSFNCFSLILVFKKEATKIILTLPYSYKLQELKKMNERKTLGHWSIATEYVAEQINSHIQQLD